MLIASVAEAERVLPEIELPVLLIGMAFEDPQWTARANTPQEYRIGMNTLLGVGPGITVVVTSLAGFNPQKERAAPEGTALQARHQPEG